MVKLDNIDASEEYFEIKKVTNHEKQTLFLKYNL